MTDIFNVCFFRAIGHMIFTLFWPLIPFLLQVACVGYMGVTVAYPLNKIYTKKLQLTYCNLLLIVF